MQYITTSTLQCLWNSCHNHVTLIYGVISYKFKFHLLEQRTPAWYFCTFFFPKSSTISLRIKEELSRQASHMIHLEHLQIHWKENSDLIQIILIIFLLPQNNSHLWAWGNCRTMGREKGRSLWVLSIYQEIVGCKWNTGFSLVVYHLCGQTGQFMFWVNG